MLRPHISPWMLIRPSYRKQHLNHAIRDGRLEISGAHVQLMSMA